MILLLSLACTPDADPTSAPGPGPGTTPATPFASATGFRPDGTGFIAEHPAMGTVSTVSEDGLAYAGGSWSLAVSLQSVRRRGTPAQPAMSAPRLVADRVEMGTDPLVWFVHDERGLEFGVDLQTRPAGEGILELLFAADGLGRPYSTGTDISYSAGDSLVHIQGLAVTDVNGEVVPATLGADCGEEPDDATTSDSCAVVIRIDDEYATYPLVVDPVITAEPVVVISRATAADSLVITEMMIDPVSVSDGRGEFFEVFNPGTTGVALDNVVIWDAGADCFDVPDEGLVIPAGEHFVFGRSALGGENGGMVVNLAYGTAIALANGEDELFIGICDDGTGCPSPSGCTVFDQVEYDSAWEGGPAGGSTDIPVGATLSLDPSVLAGDNNDPANWCEGRSSFGVGQYGTPGEANESCAFDFPFQFTYVFEELDGSETEISDCTAVRFELGDAMVTDNGGEGTYNRYTRGSSSTGGQFIEWAYDYVGGEDPIVYTGRRSFGEDVWTQGDIQGALPDDVVLSGWEAPCDDDTDPPEGGDVLFTEYVEGTEGNNKFLEVQNLGVVPTDRSTCSVRLYGNGSSTPTGTVSLGTGVIAPGAVLSICHSAATFPSASCDVTSGALGYNGNDAVELFCGGVSVDVIGRIGEDPGAAWGTSPSTANSTLERDCAFVVGDTNPFDTFDPADEWNEVGVDDATGIGIARSCP